MDLRFGKAAGSRDGAESDVASYVSTAGFFAWTTNYTGVVVFRGGLKNGSVVTFTFVFRRTASMVTSIWSGVPGLEYSVSILASAIIFFRIGDQLVVVALPSCFSTEYTGTATREACAGAAGVRP